LSLGGRRRISDVHLSVERGLRRRRLLSGRRSHDAHPCSEHSDGSEEQERFLI